MVTADGRDEILRSAASAGIDALLVKPVDPSLLIEAITAAFGPASSPNRIVESDDRGQLDGLRLLVAEDNAINQEIVISLLTGAGATVDCVGNGWLAVAKIVDGHERYDLVLMDVQMPELDGLSATRQIREHVTATQLPSSL